MTKPVAKTSCLCLLMLQWSSPHVHASEAGLFGGPETSSTHSHVHHDHYDSQYFENWSSDHAATESSSSGHDYGDARDVTLLLKALGAFKLPLAVLALVFLFTIFPLNRTLASAEITYPILSGRYTRWRPPLRAPPQPA